MEPLREVTGQKLRKPCVLKSQESYHTTQNFYAPFPPENFQAISFPLITLPAVRFLPFFALLILPFAALAQKAPTAKPFQKVEGCTWKADQWNDGDSFHVITGDEQREIVARLYFVDTPEAETAYRDRIAEQAAYFGITAEQAKDLAHEAAAFTQKTLSKPFTVWTRWRSALGRSALGRVYCIILTAEGQDLNELLVSNGLARIYGTKTVLYDGRDSKTYVAKLEKLEAEAKEKKLGGWGKNP